jgi:penicillin G amidase
MVRLIQRNSVLLRALKWIMLAVAAVITLVTCLALVYLASTKNSPSGSEPMLGLNDAVRIGFDASDIPHIKASTAGDALFALGLFACNRAFVANGN